MAGEPVSCAYYERDSRPYQETQRTFLHGNGPGIAHLVFLLHQLRCLNLPNLLDILIEETTEELNKEGKELTLVRVIKITITLTGICLARVIDGPGLVSDVGDRAHVAIALVKELRDINLHKNSTRTEYWDRQLSPLRQ
jgi:hypothetical protein